MTAYFLRVGRSLCVYSKYEKHRCNAYKKAKQFPVHTHPPPFPKGAANRLPSVTVPIHRVKGFDKNSKYNLL